MFKAWTVQSQSEVVARFSSLTSEEAKSVLESQRRLKVWLDRFCRTSSVCLPCLIVLGASMPRLYVFHLVLTSFSPNECKTHTCNTQRQTQASPSAFANAFGSLNLHNVQTVAEFGPEES